MTTLPLNRKRLRWGNPDLYKLTWDGNSLIQGGTETFVGGPGGYLKALAHPFRGAAYQNVGQGSQDIDDMIANAADVDGAFDAGRINILVPQDGTNQTSSGSTGAVSCDKMEEYNADRRAVQPWHAILAVTAPPCYLGDQVSQAATDEWNGRLDAYNTWLRRRWRTFADGLIDTREPGSPFGPPRFPNYLRATFFDTTVVDGYSNHSLFVVEPSGGATPYQRVHPTFTGIALVAPTYANGILRLQ